MRYEQEHAVDTGLTSTDDRIGPDGKISPEHRDFIKTKAITNIAESLIRRADKLGGQGIVDGIGSFEVIDGEPSTDGVVYKHLTTADASEKRLTSVLAHPDAPKGRDGVLLSEVTKVWSDHAKEFGNSTRHASIDEYDGSGKKSMHGRNFSELEYGMKRDDSKAAATAIDVFKEQRRIISAAERIIKRIT